MLILGAHLSIAKGFLALGKAAVKMDANTFQFFLRNPRGAGAKELNVPDIDALSGFLAAQAFGPVLAHAPYTLNPCSQKPETRELAARLLADDLDRMRHLPGNLYNLHPGSRGDQTVPKAAELTAQSINAALQPEQDTRVTLETMSGQGSELGQTFEELKRVLDGIDHPEKVGVCFDSCHLFAAGYDLVNNLDGVLDQFDRLIGLERLLAFHLNDSLFPLASRKDRHAPLGQGCLGFEAFVRIINHPDLQHLPMLLETPLDEAGHAEEIHRLRKAAKP